MQIINSVENKKIAQVKKLKNKKYRVLNGLFLTEGKKFCLEALNSDYKIVQTFVADDTEIINFAKENNFVNITVLTASVFKLLADTISPQGIICVVQSNYKTCSYGSCLILDNIQDAGNLGTLIRTAAAFDFLNVYLINCVDAYNEKVVRASAGNIFKVNLIKSDYEHIIKNKNKICDKMVAASGLGQDIKSINLNNLKIGLIIGNEANGIDQKLLKICDLNVKIPMTNAVESLNAGVAGGILMYLLTEGKNVRS